MAGPHWAGRNATFSFYLNNDKIVLNTKSWSCKPNLTEVVDDLCGEDRSRLDSFVNYYELQVEAYMADLKPVIALLNDTNNRDQNVLPLRKQVALTIKPNDGSKVAFVASEVSIGAWELSVSGQKERAMIKIPFKARYFDQTPTL